MILYILYAWATFIWGYPISPKYLLILLGEDHRPSKPQFSSYKVHTAYTPLEWPFALCSIFGVTEMFVLVLNDSDNDGDEDLLWSETSDPCMDY